MNRKRTGAVIGAVVAAAVAGGGALALTSGATADSQPRILAQSDALPAVVQRMIEDPDSATAEFGLDPSRAMKFAMRSRNSDAWVTPGAKGTCVWDVDGAGACATNERAARTGVVLTLLPAPGRVGEPHPDGPATWIGYVPADVTDVAVLDEKGATVAHVAPADRAFDLEANLPLGGEMRLARAGGEATSIPLN